MASVKPDTSGSNEEQTSLLHSASSVHTNNNNKKNNNNVFTAKLIASTCGCCSFGTICLIMMVFAIAYTSFAFYAYDAVFLVDENHTGCPYFARNNTPSEFYAYTTCKILTQVPLRDYWVPKANWTSVYFKPRDLAQNWPKQQADDGKQMINGILYRSTSDKAPFIITMNGYKGCNTDIHTLLPSAMLWKMGYNVLSISLRNHGKSSVNRQNPYASFGSMEHLDVLSALDYLSEEFPDAQLKHEKARVGLFGPSMGGATALIAFSKDERFRAAFVESPACLVYETLEFGARNKMGDLLGPLVLQIACSLSPFKSSNKCPTFADNPIDSVKSFNSKQAVFFQHTKADLIVPFYNSEKCVDAIRKSSAGTTVLTHYEERVTPAEMVSLSQCDNHCQMIFSDPPAFYERMRAFFAAYLQNL